MGTTADQPGVTLQVSRPTAGVGVIEVAGELDMLTAPALIRQVEAVLGEQGVRGIVLDLSKVEFLGSSGLAALVKARQLAGPVEVVLAGPLNQVAARALEVTGLDDLLSVHADTEQAIAAVT